MTPLTDGFAGPFSGQAVLGGGGPIGGMGVGGMTEVARDPGETALEIGTVALSGAGATAVEEDLIPVVFLFDPVGVMREEVVAIITSWDRFVGCGVDLVTLDTGFGVELNHPGAVRGRVGPVVRVGEDGRRGERSPW